MQVLLISISFFLFIGMSGSVFERFRRIIETRTIKKKLLLLSKRYLRIFISFNLGCWRAGGEKNIHKRSPASNETFSNVFRLDNVKVLGSRYCHYFFVTLQYTWGFFFLQLYHYKWNRDIDVLWCQLIMVALGMMACMTFTLFWGEFDLWMM